MLTLVLGLALQFGSVHRELSQAARRLTQTADPVFGAVADELAAAIARPHATCAALRQRGGLPPTRSSPVLRFVTPSGETHPLCPPRAGTAGETAPNHTAANRTPALTLRDWPGDEGSVYAELRLRDGRSLAARVDLTAIRAFARGQADDTDLRIWLGWPHGAVHALAGTNGVAGAASALPRAEVASERHRYSAGVSIGIQGLWTRTASWLPLVLALAALAGYLGLRALERRWALREEPGAQLRAALARDEIEGHLQPIIDLASGDCVGAEMLMRWRHRELGVLPALSFLHEAREAALLPAMTEACFRRVSAILDDCRELPDGFMLCVNFGADQLLQENDVERFAHLARPGGRRWYTVVELPAREALAAAMPARLSSLQDQGFLIALDDFGAGHRGGRWLERLSVDLVKIDPDIVATIGTDAVSRPVLDAIITMAREVGVKLIAEGVEHVHQSSHLRQQGVAYAQGYAFSEPVPAEDFVAAWFAPDELPADPLPETLPAPRALENDPPTLPAATPRSSQRGPDLMV